MRGWKKMKKMSRTKKKKEEAGELDEDLETRAKVISGQNKIDQIIAESLNHCTRQASLYVCRGFRNM